MSCNREGAGWSIEARSVKLALCSFEFQLTKNEKKKKNQSKRKEKNMLCHCIRKWNATRLTELAHDRSDRICSGKGTQGTDKPISTSTS